MHRKLGHRLPVSRRSGLQQYFKVPRANGERGESGGDAQSYLATVLTMPAAVPAALPTALPTVCTGAEFLIFFQAPFAALPMMSAWASSSPLVGSPMGGLPVPTTSTLMLLLWPS